MENEKPVKNMWIKWVVFWALFLFGLFCFIKDKGYCNESHLQVMEQPVFDMQSRVPLEEEYLYQYPVENYIPNSCKSVFFDDYCCRSNGGVRHQPTSREQRQKWQDAYDMHHFNAVRTYNDAYDCVWWLPNLTLRQWGRDAWVAACAMASTKSPSAALVVAFTTMLSQYGLHCADQWDYIEDKLYWSNYHFNECIKYAKLLAQ